MVKGVMLRVKKYCAVMAFLLLASIVLALYWPVAGYDFIALDDYLYVVENGDIQKGLSPQGIWWAMTTLHTTNWHPLTWLFLMADYELYGLRAPGYHVSSLLLHILNTLLLFAVLRRMTGEAWKSVIVAVLFAVHPLNIESVVWVAERKNLLSTLFLLLTLQAYVRYAEEPGWKNYCVMVILFILGLAAKPILVALPFVLLLLDYWPLQRFSWPGHSRSEEPAHDRTERRKLLIRLMVEKLPLILLSLLSAGVTFYAAGTGGAVKAASVFPWLGRIENAIISYAMYLYKMIWPMDLAIFYPYPPARPLWQILSSLLFLAAVTTLVCLKGKTHRYLITGWLWYGITLLPVIGLVQVGFQSMANRYAYISLIGIFIIAAWGAPDLLKRSSGRRYLPAASIGVILALIFCTRSALPDWKNSEAAFQQALNVTKNNHIAEIGMGNVWLDRGNTGKAAPHYLEALRLKPDYAEAHYNLGLVLMREGKGDEAAAQFREALKDNPKYPEAFNHLHMVLTDPRN